MAEEESGAPPEEPPAQPSIEKWSVDVTAPLPLPLSTVQCEKPSTLLMLIQSPEQPVVLSDYRQLRACQRCHLVLPQKQFDRCVCAAL